MAVQPEQRRSNHSIQYFPHTALAMALRFAVPVKCWTSAARCCCDERSRLLTSCCRWCRRPAGRTPPSRTCACATLCVSDTATSADPAAASHMWKAFLNAELGDMGRVTPPWMLSTLPCRAKVAARPASRALHSK